MHYLIGIDDTDNLQSRGTGARVRQLGALLAASRLARVAGITRHQLLVSPAIPYTSHNSSACMAVEVEQQRLAALADFCRDYLVRESADGSDAGLCLAERSAAAAFQAFGFEAKQRVIAQVEALALAQQANVWLEGLTGDGGGVIGALAAVGLHASGDDGRFLWLEGLRELSGIHTAAQLYQFTGIDVIRTLEGTAVPRSSTSSIDVSPWPRPILTGGKAVLLVEEAPDHAQCDWRLVPKEIVKRY